MRGTSRAIVNADQFDVMQNPVSMTRLLILAAFVGALIPGVVFWIEVLGITSDRWILWIWPSSIMLMALEGTRSRTDVVEVWLISIISNMLLYCIVALLGLIVARGLRTKPKRDEA